MLRLPLPIPSGFFRGHGVSPQGPQIYLLKNLSVVFISLKYLVGSLYIFGCAVSGPVFLNTIMHVQGKGWLL